jgi:opacity protein-like surface antigen
MPNQYQEEAELKAFTIAAMSVLLAMAAATHRADAQEVAGRWSIGGSFGLNKPVRGLTDWYGPTAKGGVSLTYIASSRVSVELEYQRTKDDRGSLVDRTFVWLVDNSNYASPNTTSTLSWNNFALNGIIRLTANPILQARKGGPYVTIGMGFYQFKHQVTNLVWPDQVAAVTGANSLNPAGPGPDGTVVIPAFADTKVALSFNAGAGLEAFVTDNIALDTKIRWHMSVGEFRPINAYGLVQTFPLQQMDVVAGVKFYFDPF